MSVTSAGILLFKRTVALTQVFLIHPGGPFYAHKDAGVWSIPKGEFIEENAEEAARREFYEETGKQWPGALTALGTVKMSGGKIIFAFAAEGEFDTTTFHSQTFDLEWPPKSGHMKSFPEADRCAWFDLSIARQKIHPAQIPFLDRLTEFLTNS